MACLGIFVAPLAAAPPSGKIPLIGVLAARQATDTTPIVFAVFADPLAEGLVGSPDSGWLVITPGPNADV
jgi:hypothetical protein